MRFGEIGDDDLVDALPLALALALALGLAFALAFALWSRATRPRGFFSRKNPRVCGNFLAGESPATIWFDQLSKYCSPRFKIVFQPQHGGGNATCLGAGKADHADAAAAGR